MSNTTIEQHNPGLSDLPLFEPMPEPFDADVELWSDLDYLRDLLDAIEDQAVVDGSGWDPIGLTTVFADTAEIDACLDWPADHAAELLDAWRHGTYPDPEIPELHTSAIGIMPDAPWLVPLATTRRRPARRTVRRFLVAMAAAAVLAGTGICYATRAGADPGIGCQTVLWGFLGSQRRTICDSPQRADGSWTRERIIWWPERWVPLSCGRYSCWGGYWQDAGGNREIYPVTPDTVLPDEPGHLVGL